MLAAQHEGTTHSYFIPMVDMLAGVVFILVILLASVNLVSRPEFADAQSKQTAISRIEKELEAARQVERRFLEPRRTAKIALETLLRRLSERLGEYGIATTRDVAAGRLSLTTLAYRNGSATLEAEAAEKLRIIAEVFVQEFPCLVANGNPAAAGCDRYSGARLSRVTVAAAGRDIQASQADARALLVMSRLATAEPQLLAFRVSDGGALFDFGGLSSQMLREGTGVPGWDIDGAVSFFFQMEVPPIAP